MWPLSHQRSTPIAQLRARRHTHAFAGNRLCVYLSITSIAAVIVVTSASTMTTTVPKTKHGDDAMMMDNGIILAATASADPFEHPLVPPTLPVSQWPHQTVFLQAGSDTRLVPSTDASDSAFTTTTTTTAVVPPELLTPQPQIALPIGIPFPFESPTFRGQFLLRLRNSTSDDPQSQQDYFRDRKRVLQTVVQGQFKKSIPMSDLYVGTVFRQPMKYPPPPLIMRILRGMFQRIAPGVILEFHSRQPRVVALYAGSAKTISVHPPGQEPDIRSLTLPESLSNWHPAPPPPQQQQQQQHETSGNRRRARPNRKTAKLLQIDPREWSLADRQQILSNPDTASHYVFDTEHVYTMEIFDESMDYGTYSIKLPVYGNFSLAHVIGNQPLTFTAVTTQNEIVYDFALWHDRILAVDPPSSSS